MNLDNTNDLKSRINTCTYKINLFIRQHFVFYIENIMSTLRTSRFSSAIRKKKIN